MSFTGPRDPSIERRAAQARQQGVVLIAAAGNGGAKSRPLYPAAYADVIAVTATDADDKLFQGANRGTYCCRHQRRLTKSPRARPLLRLR
jgi:subtilisin family serine protease